MKPADKAPGAGGGVRRKGSGSGAAKCALCAKRVTPDYRPFCSKRCADIDLGRWLKGQYAVPGVSGDAGETPAGEQ